MSGLVGTLYIVDRRIQFALNQVAALSSEAIGPSWPIGRTSDHSAARVLIPRPLLRRNGEGAHTDFLVYDSCGNMTECLLLDGEVWFGLILFRADRARADDAVGVSAKWGAHSQR